MFVNSVVLCGGALDESLYGHSTNLWPGDDAALISSHCSTQSSISAVPPQPKVGSANSANLSLPIPVIVVLLGWKRDACLWNASQFYFTRGQNILSSKDVDDHIWALTLALVSLHSSIYVCCWAHPVCEVKLYFQCYWCSIYALTLLECSFRCFPLFCMFAMSRDEVLWDCLCWSHRVFSRSFSVPP